MKTENHSIHDVLAKNATSFFIPPFQRAYAWGRHEIERYFNDVKRIVESELDENQHDKLEHFLGTLVLKEEKAGFLNKLVVVDGQQRLTTTLLFLIALRDSLSDNKQQEIITQNYLVNNSSDFQDKIKLKQVTSDWEAYRALVNKTTTKPGMITNGYLLFKKLIKEQQLINNSIKLEHYIIAIQRINVAVIFLDERPFKGEDPQIIFETLNSLGRPLTLSDLVRNFILLNMDSRSQSEIYEKTWHPKIENILNDETSKFFRDYLQYKTSSSVKVVSNNNTKEVYHLFKNFVINNFPERDDFINDIVKFAPWYRWIIPKEVEDIKEKISDIESNDKKIKELIINIFYDIKSEAFKPFVLGLFEYHQTIKSIDDELLIDILLTIRTYLIRRRTLGLTQGENKNIVLLCKEIDKLASKEKNILDLLTNMFYNLRLPNDIELKEELKTMNFYEGLKKYSKFILGKIEENNTKVAVNFRDPRITIEHIMPQKLNDNWKKELGENFDIIHKNYLHNIGNLILTEFNGEMGNKSFSEKKKKLNQSSLSYRLFVTNLEIWNESSILNHQEKMINLFLNTFPLPEKFKEKDNWHTKESNISSSSFSPIDMDAGEIAEGNKPIKLIIDNKEIKVSNWQDVFLKF